MDPLAMAYLSGFAIVSLVILVVHIFDGETDWDEIAEDFG